MRYLAVLTALLMVSFCGCTLEEPGGDIFGGPQSVDVSGLEGKAVKIVREALSDESAGIRSNAIEVIVNSKRRELMPKVIQLLKDENVVVRFTAAIAIGDMGYEAGEYTLMPMLEDTNPNVRMAAAYSLAKLGKEGYAERIRNMSMNSDATVRANAALLLGKLGKRGDLPVLYEVLRAPDSTVQVKIQAVEAIAMVGDERIYKDKLWPLLISKYADDRVMGIRGMGALGTEDAKNAIITMLSDEVSEVRLCAAEQLSRMGDTSGEAEVLGYLSSMNADFNEGSIANVFSAMAIGRIGSDALRKYLPSLLASKSPVVELSAAQSVLLLVEEK